jgi:hypothetical protein
MPIYKILSHNDFSITYGKKTTALASVLGDETLNLSIYLWPPQINDRTRTAFFLGSGQKKESALWEQQSIGPKLNNMNISHI